MTIAVRTSPSMGGFYARLLGRPGEIADGVRCVGGVPRLPASAGNIVELAVAFVIGPAFARVVESLVEQPASCRSWPMIIGKPDFRDLTFTINDAADPPTARSSTDAITFVAVARRGLLLRREPLDATAARRRAPVEEGMPDAERRRARRRWLLGARAGRAASSRRAGRGRGRSNSPSRARRSSTGHHRPAARAPR